MADIIVWIYSSFTGIIAPVPSPLATLELQHGVDWHGPFKTRQEAVDYYNANKAANPNWKPPSDNPIDVIKATESSTASTVVDKAKEALTPNLDKYGPWFIRIGEVVLGLVLIGVGLAKLTGTTNVIAKSVKAVI